MTKSIYLFLSNKQERAFITSYLNTEKSGFFGFITELVKNIPLKESSQIALISLHVIQSKDKAIFCQEKEVHVGDSVLMNLCSDNIEASFCGNILLPVLQNFVFDIGRNIEIFFPKPMFHNLNVSVLSSFDIYFKDVNGGPIYLNRDTQVTGVFHLKI